MKTVADALDPSDSRYEMGCWITRRKPCGCILEICSDDVATITREFLEEAKDRDPEHMKLRDAYAEPTFFKCPHRAGEPKGEK